MALRNMNDGTTARERILSRARAIQGETTPVATAPMEKQRPAEDTAKSRILARATALQKEADRQKKADTAQSVVEGMAQGLASGVMQNALGINRPKQEEPQTAPATDPTIMHDQRSGMTRTANLYKSRINALEEERLKAEPGAFPVEKQRELNALKSKRGQIGAKYYDTENREQLERLGKDKDSAARFEDTSRLEDDLAKIDALSRWAAAPASPNGNAEELETAEQYKTELAERYGVSKEDLDQLPLFGTASAMTTPDSNPGYAALRALTEDLQDRIAAGKEGLGGAGFNYERMKEYLRRVDEAKTAAEDSERMREFAREHPVVGSALTVPFAMAQGLDLLPMYASGGGSLDDLGNYVPMDANMAGVSKLVNDVRGAVAGKIAENTNWNIFGQNVAAFLYQTGMSVVDSTAQIVAMGPGSVYLMGLSSAANSTREIVENGGSNSQAFWGGLAAGAAEVVFEKVSLDNLLKPRSVTGWKEFLKGTLEQAGVECSEEVFTEIANIFSQAVILGEGSDFNRAVRGYIADGYSEEAAKKQALLDAVAQVGWAGAGGFLSGAAMGGAVTGANFAMNNLENLRGRSVTNREAELILQNEDTVQMLKETAGLELRDEMTMAQRRAAVKKAVRGLADTKAKSEAAQNDPLGKNGKKAFETVMDRYLGTMAPDEAAGSFMVYYQAGVTGGDVESVSGPYAGKLSEADRMTAYFAGKNDAAEVKTQMATEEEFPFTVGDNDNKEGRDYGKEGDVRVRDGGQWADGASEEERAGRLEEGTVRDPEGEDRGRPADAGAAALRIGQAVTTASLGIAGGAENDAVHVVEHGSDTESTRKAREIGKKNGLRVVVFTGGDLHVRNGAGEMVEARGYIVGDRMFVRADHPELTADQLARHEEYHFLEETRGAVSSETTKENLQKLLGKEQMEWLAQLYRDAHEGQTMTEEDIWREIAADQYAGMNAFQKTMYEEEWDALNVAVGYQTQEQLSQKAETPENGTRGSPGRMSVEHDARNVPYVVIEEDVLAGVPEDQWVDTIKENLKRKYPDGVTIGRSQILIDKQSQKETAWSRYSRWLQQNDPELYGDKLRAVDDAGEILRATRDYVNEPPKHVRKDEIVEFARGTVQMRIGGKDYKAEVVVGTRKNGEMVLYDLVNIEPTTIKEKSRNATINREPVTGSRQKAALNSPGESIAQDTGSCQEGKSSSEANRKIMEELRAELAKNKELERRVKYWKRQAHLTPQEQLSQKAETPENGTRGSPGEFSREAKLGNERYRRHVAEWFSEGRPEGEQFILGTTGDVLQGLGAMESDIYMLGDKMSEIMEKHPEMGQKEFERLPEVLDDPVLILKSQGKNRTGPNTRLVVFGSVKGENGLPVLCVLDLRPVENRLVVNDMQKVNSAYTKTQNPAEFVRRSEILYADKKRTAPLLSSMAFKGTIELQRSGSMGSITYKGPNVKLEGVPFSDVVKESPAAQQSGKTSSEANRKIMEELRAELAKNKELERRVKYWKRQAHLTPQEKGWYKPEWKPELTRVRATAREIMGSMNIKGMSQNEVTLRLNEIYELISAGHEGQVELSWEAVKERADALAWDLVEHATEGDPDIEALYGDMMDYFRKTEMTITEEASHDIVGYAEWRQKSGLKIKKGDVTNVDQVYKEVCGMWPEFFNEEAVSNPADQAIQMAEVVRSIRDAVNRNPLTYDAERARQAVARDILNRYWDIPNDKGTIADQWQKKVMVAKAEAQEALDQLRTSERRRCREKVQEVKDWYRERDNAVRDRKKDSDLRNRLLKTLQRAEKLAKRTTGENQAALRELIGDIDTVSRSLTGKNRTDLQELAEWVEELQKDPDYILDEKTQKNISRLSKIHINDLTTQECVDLLNNLLAVEHTVREGKYLIQEEERRDIYQLGQAIVTEMDGARGSRLSKMGGSFSALENMRGDLLAPMRRIREMVDYDQDSPLLKAAEALNEGQRKALDYRRRALAPFEKFANDKEFSREFSGKDAREIKIGGWDNKTGELTEVSVTPAMVMAIYLHSKNNQNARHIKEGGVKVPDWTLYKKGDVQGAYAHGRVIKLSPNMSASLYVKLNAKELDFMRKLQTYFGEMSRTELGATSDALLGYHPEWVESYFPIITDSNFLHQDMTMFKEEGMGSVLKPGFMEDRKDASQPIMLLDADVVLNRSILKHSLYVGMAIPVRNFNKIWNVSTVAKKEDGTYLSYAGSVKGAVENAWGKSGVKYIENMVQDTQGRQYEKDVWSGMLDKIRSNYAGAVLSLNWGVAMKQAASYPTAAAVLGWKPLAKAMAHQGKVDLKVIEKYTPLLWYRMRGYSNQELGDIATNKENMPKMLNWIQGVDVFTVKGLWTASEYYVRENNKAMAVGSDAYYREVAKVFDRVVEETQPNYTAMQRPGVLRSKSQLVQAVTMFKTQPMQNFGILYDAVGEYTAVRRRAKAGQATEADVKASKQNLSRAVSSQIISQAVFAGMTAAVAALRGKWDKYEDDEGNTTVTSFLKRFIGDILNSFAGMIPGGAEALGIADALVNGSTYYGMDVVSVSAVNDFVSVLVSSRNKIVKMADREDMTAGEVAKDITRIVDDLALKGSKLLGFPLENIQNTLVAAYRWGAMAVTGSTTMGEYMTLKLTTDKASAPAKYYNLLYQAKGKKPEVYEQLYGKMVEDGFAKSKIKSAMETRMKKAAGVKSVDDLERRYLAPDEEKVYERALELMEGDRVYKRASEEQRTKAADWLYDYTARKGGEAGEERWGRLEEAKVAPEKYALYRLALEVVDKPNEKGELGTTSKEERIEAMDLMRGLTREQKVALWRAAGGTEASCPY